MSIVQEFPPALSVPTTLAARPLSARSLLRTLRLGLRGAGRAAGSATPSITLAFAPESRLAIICSMNSIERSSCSSVIALTPPLWSSVICRGTSKTSSFRNTAGWFRITFCIAFRPPRRKARCISRMVSAFSACVLHKTRFLRMLRVPKLIVEISAKVGVGVIAFLAGHLQTEFAPQVAKNFHGRSCTVADAVGLEVLECGRHGRFDSLSDVPWR
jgi:hypothetical protein